MLDDNQEQTSPAPVEDNLPAPPPKKRGLRGFLQSLIGGIATDTPDTTEYEHTGSESTPPETPEEDTYTDEELEKRDAACLVPAKNNKLYQLYCWNRGLPPEQNPDATFHLSALMPDDSLPSDEQCGWLKNMDRDIEHLPEYGAASILAVGARDAGSTGAAVVARSTDDAPQDEAEAKKHAPVDATAIVKVSADKMSAYIFMLPPFFDGKHIAANKIMELLAVQNVVFNIDEISIKKACEKQDYLKLLHIAQGEEPINGEDGEIIDHFKRELEIQLTVKEDNTIDYKDLGWLQSVLADEAICDIIAPTVATPGKNVYGNEIPGKDGRKATPPSGQNTAINEEGTHLVASINGAVSFASGRFRVDPLVIIKGDVETATGNLDIVGDALIYGDVREGFSVKATGNITVQGMVEGATLTAGGNIQVGRGMNGNTTGSMTAKGDVLCKFLENVTVTAGGRIICDTIINSEISSDESVIVKTGRGSIIGGSITALKNIEAKTIGNQSNRSIEIRLGNTTSFIREKQLLEEQLAELSSEIESKEKNILFLSKWEDKLDYKAAKALDDLRLGLSVQNMQLANLKRKMLVVERRQQDNGDCRLKAETLYPPVSVTIGNFSKTLRETIINPVIFLKDGEIHIALINVG